MRGALDWILFVCLLLAGSALAGLTLFFLFLADAVFLSNTSAPALGFGLCKLTG
jgi:hypothetical protein